MRRPFGLSGKVDLKQKERERERTKQQKQKEREVHINTERERTRAQEEGPLTSRDTYLDYHPPKKKIIPPFSPLFPLPSPPFFPGLGLVHHRHGRDLLFLRGGAAAELRPPGARGARSDRHFPGGLGSFGESRHSDGSDVSERSGCISPGWS